MLYQPGFFAMVYCVGIKLVQQCRSCEGWTPVEIQSQSDIDTKYVIMVSPWDDHNDNICDCKGYKFRGHCSHQYRASAAVCRWSETEGPEGQTPRQKDEQECPRCGMPTKYQMEYVEDE